MNYRNLSKLSIGLLGFTLFTACSDDDETKQELGGLIPAEEVFGKANDVFTADEWFPGGQLGTTEKASYSAPAPAVKAFLQWEGEG